MRRAIPLLSCLLLSLPLTGWAGTPATHRTPSTHSSTALLKFPPAVHVAVEGGFRIVRSFKAVSGLTGWVAESPSGQYSVFFSTADGQSLIAGALVSSSGENLAARYYSLYVPHPDFAKIWNKLKTAAVVVDGAKTPKSTIYVVMDPNCIYCHMLWIALKPYEAEGLQVRWLPVGFLHADSPGKAAAILKGGAPVLTQSQEKFDVNHETGGVPPIPVTQALGKELAGNIALMREAQDQGTPGIFYKDRSGVVHTKFGMPLMSELPSITGLPLRKETAPILANFNR